MDKKKIFQKDLDDIMSLSFGRYAKYIIQERALPDIRDGLKPVQRRVLYGMYNLGLYYNKSYRKSAATVGEVIGKFHPHGDSSIYEALVRMTQSWKNNIPLIDMQGNNGSIDGDNAAAMRYTEARLSHYGNLMLENINKETVNFVNNFDDSEVEPTILPSLLPNLLVNGSTGIAAGYATNIPPFNLKELIDVIIHRIDSPNCKLESILKLMPGPDFPTGGIILDDDGIKNAYLTGKGKIVIRAKIVNENDQLVVTDIPFETNKASIIRSIEEILEANKLPQLEEVRDESDRFGIRIVLQTNTKDEKVLATIKNYLYKYTQLQINYSFNNVVIDQKKPIQMSIFNYLDSYLNHAYTILRNAISFDLKKDQKRLEVINGLIKATSIIDQIILIIKKSKDKQDAINNLINKYQFSAIQAEAIVSLRLYRLTNTDILALKEEKKSLDTNIKQYQLLLKDQNALNDHLKEILRSYKKLFNTKRRSTIGGNIEKLVINEASIIEKKELYLVSSVDGLIKTIAYDENKQLNPTSLKIKQDDYLSDLIKVSSLNKVAFITNYGNVVVINAHKIKQAKPREIGMDINELTTIKDNEKIVKLVELSDQNDRIVLVSKYGMIKQISVNDLVNIKSTKPTTCMSLKDDDELVCANLVSDPNAELIIITKNAYALRFFINEVNLTGLKSMGVRAIKLKTNDQVIGFDQIKNSIDQLVLVKNKQIKKLKASLIENQSRATQGKNLGLGKDKKPLVNGYLLNTKEAALYGFNRDNELVNLELNQIMMGNLSSEYHDWKDEFKCFFLNKLNYE
ncbi:DNA topoisomerase IV subunit A [Mycoplasmoides gallisepticum CA06_2006.052-5-2P]|uniref:DNA topoisomerase (ATP-hydrolyzing) n=2 Tax=Mycoplasmoides gallisepticum TaxID=2096 RepID=J3YH57_MYCGL|nr:DNA topoisomerase IV subunit A [Mycoplasmoides gallisepticum]AFP75998.1 DNA topoisomerase IV subunit A [Mycoplasmoides gallisepticum VA94_7994-1-7P]AFP76765.1 DNA topoisomerase IV subunit A [Mycoplasmoides gallisepticum NC95_13295-2-2P]AFP77519.1 DNA topoisomerase IV subunit A [Mycoplasmoides gallisepticum NC96_1596-4-2P]AFP78290.1 DNA topoisomerase IV subunit A [Mycoplasmoides gallisepticum NY01_2001.047-5-1P]AFP79050.1 DNA topoisomerase IV subunit A [Mycoplasmoides gallisepticum WI01_2001